MNGSNKFLSRSFWISFIALVGGFALSFYLQEGGAAQVITPAVITGWFGGKFAESMVKRNGG